MQGGIFHMLNDAACVGTDCTCCAAAMTEPQCVYDDLDVDSAAYFDALGGCACTTCLADCTVECGG